jgi:hypothetical protein
MLSSRRFFLCSSWRFAPVLSPGRKGDYKEGLSTSGGPHSSCFRWKVKTQKDMQDGHSINKQTNSSCRQADQAGGGGGGSGSKAAAVGRDREKGSNVEQQEATAAGQVVGTTFEKLFESAIGGKECCIIASQACLCNRFAPKAPCVVIPVGCGGGGGGGGMEGRQKTGKYDAGYQPGQETENGATGE